MTEDKDKNNAPKEDSGDSGSSEIELIVSKEAERLGTDLSGVDMNEIMEGVRRFRSKSGTLSFLVTNPEIKRLIEKAAKQ